MLLLDWLGGPGALPRGAHISTDVQYFGDGPVLLAPYVRVDTGCVLTGMIHLGHHTHIAPYCLLYGKAGITIDEYANVGAFGVIHTESEDFTGQFPMGPWWPEEVRRPERVPVRVDARATIGTRCTLLPGAGMGEGSILGAHSLLKRRVPENEVWAGTPAHFKRFASVGQFQHHLPT